MLGAGLFAGGLVGAPFVFACGSCPPARSVRYAYEVSAHTIAQASALETAQACELMCGGPVQSCETARMVPGSATAESRRLYSTMEQPIAGQEPPHLSEVVICEVMERFECGGIGRPPEGLADRHESLPGVSPLVAHAERAAHLEAASVIAFVQLATELEAHGAPTALIDAAERSAVDEVRHARAAARLAVELGGRVPPSPVVTIPAPRRLSEVLRENAAVGGVEETYGAWLLAHQGLCATDVRVRRFTAGIANDELRHGQLADAIDRWGRPLLSRAERTANDEAVSEAWTELRSKHAQDPRASFAKALGLPSAGRACEWIDAAKHAS